MIRKCSSNFSVNDLVDCVNNKILNEVKEIKKPKSISLENMHKEKRYIYNRHEFKKEAIKFLSNIQLKTKEELLLENQTAQPTKVNIKKINVPDNPTKIADLVNELMEYSKDKIVSDAVNYLTKLSKINKDSEITNSKKLKKEKSVEFIEVEENDGLKLIKLDSTNSSSIKVSYYFHLEIKTNYHFAPLICIDSDDASQEMSENLYEIHLKRYKSKNSSRGGTDNIYSLINDMHNLKYILFFKICLPLDLDMYLAGCAWIYFEFLVKKGVVNKKNKSLYLCVVFLLALKYYDIDDKKYFNF